MHCVKLWSGSRVLLKPSAAGWRLPWANSSSFHHLLCQAKGPLKHKPTGERCSFSSLQLLFYIFFLSPPHAPVSKEITFSFYPKNGFSLPPHMEDFNIKNVCSWELSFSPSLNIKGFLPASELQKIVIKIKYVVVTDENYLNSQASYKQSVMTDHHMLSFPSLCQKTS